MSKKLSKQLEALSHQQLQDIIKSLYGNSEALDEKIFTLVLVNEPSSMANNLSQRINKLACDDCFISYSASQQFSCDIESLLDEIEKYILPENSALALSLVEKFLATADDVYERCDDSMGCIGEVYRNAIMQWLSVAQQVRKLALYQEIHWLERVSYYFDNNDYGVFDDIIPNSADLLSKDELLQLAVNFESDAKQALSSKQSNQKSSHDLGYNRTVSHACIGLKSVAEALKDIDLFEQATLLASPEPNELQMKSLVKFALSIKRPNRAMVWLNKPWSVRFQYDHVQLLEQCYQLQGNTEALKQSRQQSYLDNPSYYTLNQLCQLCDEKEQKTLQQQAIKQASSITLLATAIELLLKFKEISQANSLLLARRDELVQVAYSHLTAWAKIFAQQSSVKHQYLLAEMLCYRTLLDDILEQGRSKAYHHAASYFKKLQQSAKQFEQSNGNYQGIINQAQYVAQLQSKHWRKRSFWQQANYPNK
jgi:hypothetical protein